MADSRADELRRRLERDPDSRLFAQLAEELRKAGDVEEAIGIARTGLEKHPTYPSARLTLGRALLDSGDPAAARVELETAVRDAPDNILASRLLGEALETLGDLGAALLQYRTTLEMAPGDKHVESRVRAIQDRLGGPAAPPEGEAGRPADVTKPMPALPHAEAGIPPLGAEEDADLPATIRIRMPGDALRVARAPLPPTAGWEGASDGAEGSAPATRAGPGGGGGQAEAASGEQPPSVATDAELAASELPVTLPMPGKETSPPDDEAGQPAEEAERGADASPDGNDMAPTLPRSRAPEFAALDEALPPTLPPGVITSVEAFEEADAAGSEPGTTALEAEEEGTDTAATEDAAATEDEVPGESADGEMEAEAAETEVAAMADAGPDDGPEPAPLSSATLAELYFQQGLLERAVEVYRQVLEEEPGNDLARARLEKIEALVSESAAELPVPASDGGGDEREVRRRALERAIERLEALLVVVRRR